MQRCFVLAALAVLAVATPVAGQSVSGQQFAQASKLIGKSVYDADNRRIGEIEDLLIRSDGAVEAAVVDIGGFLGVGERRVAIQWSMLRIDLRRDRIALVGTDDQLSTLPEFEEPGALPLGRFIPGTPEQRSR